MKHVVIDTNVLISATLKQNSPPHEILKLWQLGKIELISSKPLIEELAAVLTRPHIRKLQWLSEAQVAQLIWLLSRALLLAPGEVQVQNVSRDPKDDMVLSAAIEMDADYIVTGDQDLLSLEAYEGIRILTPRQLLQHINT